MDEDQNPTNDNLENVEVPSPEDESEPPVKKKRVRKSKAKKHQVGAKVKNRNQRDYKKFPAKIPPNEVEVVTDDAIFFDMPAYELEPLPDLPDKSKLIKPCCVAIQFRLKIVVQQC